ncbi:FCD domain-containing protein [Dehalobacter sp. DCM]|uniref:FCD domain-containing protein n=1 Tax=Dehalobacter sp. DCM TaxID=2907827 RepID=UPI003FCE951D
MIYIISKAYMNRYWSSDFISPDLGHHATHMRILELIRNHDAEQARKAMIEHFEFGRKFNQLYFNR